MSNIGNINSIGASQYMTGMSPAMGGSQGGMQAMTSLASGGSQVGSAMQTQTASLVDLNGQDMLGDMLAFALLDMLSGGEKEDDKQNGMAAMLIMAMMAAGGGNNTAVTSTQNTYQAINVEGGSQVSMNNQMPTQGTMVNTVA